MSYHIDGTDLVLDGFENGIAESPYFGCGDMRCVNTITVPGEVSVSFKSSGMYFLSLTNVSTTAVASTDVLTLSSGSAIRGTAFTTSGGSGLTSGTTYYMGNVSGSDFKAYERVTDALGITSGSAVNITADGSVTLSTIKIGTPLQDATDLTSSTFKYFILDENGRVWGYYATLGGWYYLNNRSSSTIVGPIGIQVYHGWLFFFSNGFTYVFPTDPTADYQSGASHGGYWWNLFSVLAGDTTATRASIVPFNDILYFANSTSLASYSAGVNYMRGSVDATDAGSDTITITVETGSRPYIGQTISFYGSGFAGVGITENTRYYIVSVTPLFSGNQFDIEISTTSGGSVLNITGVTTGSFNDVNVSNSNINYTAITLPAGEPIRALGFLGDNILIGSVLNKVYPWDKTSTSFTTPIYLAEDGVSHIITTNTNAYIFAGNRGRIYVTNGSQARLYKKIPDFITGKHEPYYTIQSAEYHRNQIYFSFTAYENFGGTQITTIGGLWAIDNETGALRHVVKPSYGTYNGYYGVIIPDRSSTNPAGFGLFLGYNSGAFTYGVDIIGSGGYTGGETMVETDIVKIGLHLNKRTLTNVEFKLAVPIVAGESVSVYQRKNLSDAFSLVGTTSTAGALSDVYSVNFENVEWLQLRAVLTSVNEYSTPTFVRLKELRIR